MESLNLDIDTCAQDLVHTLEGSTGKFLEFELDLVWQDQPFLH